MNRIDNAGVGEIHISQAKVDEIAGIVTSAYETLMSYLYSVSMEIMDDETKEFFGDACDEDRHHIIFDNLRIHFRKISNACIEASEPLNSMALVSYFDDLDQYLSNNLAEPFGTLEQFQSEGLSPYLEDSVSSLNMSTLDYFWASRFKSFLNTEKLIDASLLLTLDYTHIFFDVFCDKFNELLNLFDESSFYEENRMSLQERINTFIEEELESELLNVANLSIRDFCNILIDPYSSVIMKAVRYMEEATYSHLEGIEEISKFLIKEVDGEFKVNKGKLYNDTYNDLMQWARSNQDLNTFTEDDIKLLNTHVSLDEMKAEAYDIADSHSQYHSGMSPEDAVVSIHARYLVIEKLYLEYFLNICETIEELSMNQIKSVYEKYDSKEEISSSIKYEIDILKEELIKNAIIETSHITWRDLLPQDAEKIIIDNDQ